MATINTSRLSQGLSAVAFTILLTISPARVAGQTTDSAASQVDSGPATDTSMATAPQTDPPVDPLQRQNRLQATSLTGAPSGAGGDGGLPGVAERVPGMAKVESSGAASYEIGVIVPPGIVAPQLSFAYDSQGTRNSDGTNGLLGVAWSLKGLRTIQRCPRTVAQDGIRWGVNYDNNDRFCLDGSRLMAISGAYGANLTEYRTEVDNFIKVISYGQAGNGPAFFKAWTKQGEVMEFGVADDSRIEAQGKTTVRAWALNKMQDVKGNFFTVTYFEDNDNGEYRPIRIDYTGNTGIPTTRSVQFTYGPRTDQIATYVGGSRIKITQLLTKVQTFAPPSSGGPAVLVREYRLAYENSTATRRSRLTSITECDGDGSCSASHALPPTTFTWQEGGAGGFSTSLNLPDNGLSNDQTWVGDFNADGISDILTAVNNNLIVYLSQPNGTYNIVSSPKPAGWNASNLQVGDYDGDGQSDIAWNNNSKLYYVFSNGDGTFTALAPLTQPSGWSGAHMWSGDWDGDGRTDLVSHNNGKLYFAFSQFVNKAGNFFSPVPAPQDPTDGFGDGKTWVGDVNKDGKNDLVTYANNKLITIFNISGADGTYETKTNPIPNSFGSCLSTTPNAAFLSCWLADFNGDGSADIVSHNNGFHFAFSLGNGLFDFSLPTAPDPVAGWDQGKVWVGDMNADGKFDLVTNQNGLLIILFSNGDGTYREATSPQPQNWNGTNAWAGDFLTGDGKTDVVSHNNAQITFASATGPYPDLITTITTPFQGVNSITYKPLTDSSVYTKDTAPPFAASYPIVDVQSPIYVVSDMTLSDADNNYSFSYLFTGAKSHYLGRNFVGFRVIDMVNESAGARNITFYNQGLNQGVSQFDQNFANIGSPQTQEIESLTCDLPNNLVVQTTNGYTITTPFTGVKRLLQSSVDTYEWECGTTNRHSRRTLAFDSFGNLTEAFNEGVVGVSGDERDEVTDWVVDVTNWIHRPQRKLLKNGTGDILREKWLFYDKQTYGVLNGPGLLTKEENDAGSGSIGDANNAVNEYDYDATTGAQTFSKDPRGCEITTTYDSTMTFPIEIRTCSDNSTLNFRMAYTYDPRFGTKLTETDWNDQITRHEYDGFGRLTKTTNIKDYVAGSLHGTETTEYLDWGTPDQRVKVSKTIENGHDDVLVSEQFFDGFGRVDQLQTQGPSGSTVLAQSKFDSRNLIVEKFPPRFLTEPLLPSRKFKYDVLGRETEVTQPDGRTSARVYAPGQVTLYDELNRPKVFFIDVYNQLSQVREFIGGTSYDTFYEYDAAGQLTEIENSQGHITMLEYDRLGRRTAMCDPNMGTPYNVANCTATVPATPGAWFYTYNPAGDLLKQLDAKNQTLCTSYDEMGRPISKKQGSNCDTILTNYTYDTNSIQGTDFPKGKLTQVVDYPADVTTKFAFDELGRFAKSDREFFGSSHIMSYTYDAIGRTKTQTFPDSEAVAHVYDGPSLKSITGYINDIEYNGRGQITSVTYANNIVITFIYFDQPSDTRKNFRIRQRLTSNGLQDLRYDYDDVNNIISINDYVWSGTRSVLAYDELNRLTHADGTFDPVQNSVPQFKSCNYVYDSIGNIINKCDPRQFVYGESMHPSAVTYNPITGKSYTYDSNGNMISRGNQTLTWDFENHVTSISLSGSTTTMEYDYTGARVKKYAPAASMPTQYLFKEYEIDPSGTITKYIKIGSETFASKKTVGDTSTEFFYHNDHLRGVNVISDFNGAKQQLMEYDPWGTISRAEGPTQGSQPTADIVHAFTGQELDDPETGLYYFGGRYYDAEISRFVSPDIVVQTPDDPQNLNHYSYVINNPVALSDPSGFFFEELIIGAIIGATIGGIEAAITHGNVGMGILTGAVSGAIFGGVSSEVGTLIAQAGVPGGIGPPTQAWLTAGQIGGSVAGGAAAGAAAAGINGGNIGQGMLAGGITAGLTAGLGVPKLDLFGNDMPIGSMANRLVNTSLMGAGIGAAYSAATGGNVGRGAWMSAATWAGGDVANSLIGHAVGFIGSGFKGPIFMDGVFVYGGNPSGGHITLGNAVWASADITSPEFIHEQRHSLFQGTLLGPAYLPAHILDKATFTLSLEYSRTGLGGAGAVTYNDLVPPDRRPWAAQSWWPWSK